LVVRELEQAGVGDLYQAFERLRRKLAEEGLFEESRKRPLPAFPRKLALLTSPIGAAVHDVVSTLRKRWPMVDVVLIPTPVSGATSAAGIAKALGLLRAVEGVEVAILARGGGAMEELAGFNAEEVARAIAASPVPIVTGIGHESDFTIADFVADHRAPTPTGAAAAAVPDRRELLRTVLARRRAAAQRLERLVERHQRELALLRARPVLRTPRLLFASQRQRVDEVMVAVRQQVTRRLDGIRDRVTRATERLEALNPTSVLARGYSITRLSDGTVVRSARQLALGTAAEVILSEGSAEVEVRKLREPSNES
jgi:exodeoxyribonuclease VII large subunit